MNDIMNVLFHYTAEICIDYCFMLPTVYNDPYGLITTSRLYEHGQFGVNYILYCCYLNTR